VTITAHVPHRGCGSLSRCRATIPSICGRREVASMCRT
jgi:hypothetical protein